MIAFGLCEKGPCRKENQDAILMCRFKRSGLFLVADGVGGCPSGAEASRYLVERYRQWWQEVFVSGPENSFSHFFAELKQLAEQINREICGQYGPGNSCSTVVLLFIHQGIFGYLSAGDSRIYFCGKNGAKRITRDDTWENTPDAKEGSIHAGKIISAVGGDPCLEYSCATGSIHWGEVFLLCSDGIYKFVEESFLYRTLKKIRQSPFFYRKWVEALVRQALAGDTNDNYSLIAVKL